MVFIVCIFIIIPVCHIHSISIKAEIMQHFYFWIYFVSFIICTRHNIIFFSSWFYFNFFCYFCYTTYYIKMECNKSLFLVNIFVLFCLFDPSVCNVFSVCQICSACFAEKRGICIMYYSKFE
jgi:hypothetical protein